MSKKERIASIPIAEVEKEIEELVAQAEGLREKLQATERTAREREMLLRLIAERGWDPVVRDLRGVKAMEAIALALQDGARLSVRALHDRMARRGFQTKSTKPLANVRAMLQRAQDRGIVRQAAAQPDGLGRWELVPRVESRRESDSVT